MAIDAGFKLNFGLIVACSGYPHPNWDPGEKFSPLIICHGLFDDVVPIDASRTNYEKVKSKSSKLCKLLEFDGVHQIDSNLINIGYVHLSNKLISFKKHKLIESRVSDEADNAELASKLWILSEEI